MKMPITGFLTRPFYVADYGFCYYFCHREASTQVLDLICWPAYGLYFIILSYDTP